MRHHPLPRVLAILALCLLPACSKEDENLLVVPGVHDKSADFSSYRTYDLVESDDMPEGRKLPRAYLESNRLAVEQSIIREMESRGYVRDSSNPDLLVSPLVRFENVEVTVVQPYWSDYYYGSYWGYGYPWYDMDVDVVRLASGTLVIDVVDVVDPNDEQDDKLVFRGYATAVLPARPTDVSARIPAIITKIFSSWPTVVVEGQSGK
jgi:hypothetical protein